MGFVKFISIVFAFQMGILFEARLSESAAPLDL
jgi:hypothetical protein